MKLVGWVVGWLLDTFIEKVLEIINAEDERPIDVEGFKVGDRFALGTLTGTVVAVCGPNWPQYRVLFDHHVERKPIGHSLHDAKPTDVPQPFKIGDHVIDHDDDKGVVTNLRPNGRIIYDYGHDDDEGPYVNAAFPEDLRHDLASYA